MATNTTDNTKTIVNANLGVVKAHFEVSLAQLTRAANTAAQKHGSNSMITLGYTDEANKLAKIIATMQSA